MTGHTKEPCSLGMQCEQFGACYAVENGKPDWCPIRQDACISALASIPDPAAFVQAARGMAEALEAMLTASQPQAVHRVYIGEAQDMADTALTAFRAATGGEA